MEINSILCIDSENGISLNNNIPWHIPGELKYFNTVTTYCENYFSSNSKLNAVLMESNIWKGLQNKILYNRYNYVLSSEMQSYQNCLYTSNNIKNIIDDIETKDIDKLFIIGGKNIYEHFINNNLVKYVYLSKINSNYKCDNCIILNLNNYKIITQNTEKLYCLNKNQYVDITFIKYENINYVNNKYWCYIDNMPYINFEELQYLNIMQKILDKGHWRLTRNAYTYSIFGEHLVFNLENNILPLLTTKKMFVRGIIEELLFFLRGDTNSKLLENKNVNIWKYNTTKEFINSVNLNYKEGDMGPMYGFQLRHFNAKYNGCNENYDNQGIDQFKEILYDLEHNKFSRRILMTTYNPNQAKQGVLYPCHGLVIQFGIENDNLLCCHMYQRSADYFLGVPFNITSYGFLVHIICNILKNLKPGKLYISFGDVHLYNEYTEIAKEQLKNIPFMFPKLNIKKQISLENINEITNNDFEIIGYNSHQKLNATMIA